MKTLMDFVKTKVRVAMRGVAGGIDHISGGRISPDAVTIFGFAMHVPIAILIAYGHPLRAAVLLVIFGLFDTLDGELARLQNRASVKGMLLDASTDRMKEVILYVGIAYFFANGAQPKFAVWAVAACGASLCVSYVKAKGEAAVASTSKKIPHATLNRMFADGLLTFEVRMAILFVGLVSGYLAWAVGVIAIGATYTAMTRLVKISRSL